MEIFISFISGIISGILSGLIVYYITKTRENKYFAYCNLRTFLFSALEKCEIYLPLDILNDLRVIDKNNKKLSIALTEIIDHIHPENSNDKEYSESDTVLFNNIKIALEELNTFAKKNHFQF